MTEKRTSIFENGLIWFGAGVSLAEILTGTYFASLGFGKGLLAIIIGHIIGCTMLFLLPSERNTAVQCFARVVIS